MRFLALPVFILGLIFTSFYVGLKVGNVLQSKNDVRSFEVGSCIALVMRIEAVNYDTGRYLQRPTAVINSIVWKITKLNDQNRLYLLTQEHGPYPGLKDTRDYDFTDSNYQLLNCDERYP